MGFFQNPCLKPHNTVQELPYHNSGISSQTSSSTQPTQNSHHLHHATFPLLTPHHFPFTYTPPLAQTLNLGYSNSFRTILQVNQNHHFHIYSFFLAFVCQVSSDLSHNKKINNQMMKSNLFFK